MSNKISRAHLRAIFTINDINNYFSRKSNNFHAFGIVKIKSDYKVSILGKLKHTHIYHMTSRLGVK